jgi:glutathione S-transferase
MGKIPVLESPDGWIGETVAILEYLEDAHPQMPLRPDAPGERARTRQIINVVQMYVEAPARSLFPGVFGGGENSPATLTQTRTTLDRATTALARLTNPAPFLLGSQLTNADLFAFYNLDIADRVTRFLDHRSIVAEAGLADWHARLTERASSHVVLSDFEPYFGRYLEDKGAAYRAPAPAAGTPAHA